MSIMSYQGDRIVSEREQSTMGTPLRLNEPDTGATHQRLEGVVPGMLIRVVRIPNPMWCTLPAPCLPG